LLTQVKLKEAVIDDSEVVRGIVEYAKKNRVNTIVIGAAHSNKNTLARTLYLRSGSKLSVNSNITYQFLVILRPLHDNFVFSLHVQMLCNVLKFLNVVAVSEN